MECIYWYKRDLLATKNIIYQVNRINIIRRIPFFPMYRKLNSSLMQSNNYIYIYIY